MSAPDIPADVRDEDLNRVIAVLHKELERGYVQPGQAIALAHLIDAARAEGAAQALTDAADGFLRHAASARTRLLPSDAVTYLRDLAGAPKPAEPEPCTATHTVQDFWQGLVGDVTYHCVRLGPHEVHSDSHEREW